MNRIKVLLLAISAGMLSQAANGQAQVGIGLKGGVNFASLSGVSNVGTGTRTGPLYHFGAYALIKFTKFAIQPEVVYSMQGQSNKGNGATYGADIDYINIPVMAKLYLAGGFNLQAGPQFGFVSKANGSLIDTKTGATTSGQDIKSYVKSSDFSFGVGFGWDLISGLNIAARYNIGFSDINQFTGGVAPNGMMTSLGTTSAKNRVFQISIGYRLFKFGI